MDGSYIDESHESAASVGRLRGRITLNVVPDFPVRSTITFPS
jgi:hypothetical protein